jgi:hypothetical protein
MRIKRVIKYYVELGNRLSVYVFADSENHVKDMFRHYGMIHLEEVNYPKEYW